VGKTSRFAGEKAYSYVQIGKKRLKSVVPTCKVHKKPMTNLYANLNAKEKTFG